MKFEFIAFSDQGLVRTNNEDVFLVNNEVSNQKRQGRTTVNNFAVFDGIGGMEGGELASFEAATFLARYPFTKTTVNEVITRIKALNDHVVAVRYEKLNGGGTTVAGVLVNGEQAFVYNVGDSRVYRYREGVCKQISVDHSINSFDPEHNQIRSFITQYIGKSGLLGTDIRIAFERDGFLDGDVFIVCSDGVSDLIKTDKMSELITKHQNFEELSEEINKLIIKRGAHDNFTYILVQKAKSGETN